MRALRWASIAAFVVGATADASASVDGAGKPVRDRAPIRLDRSEISRLATEVVQAPIGLPWSQHRKARADCVEFHGGSYSISTDECWVYRCTSAWKGGTRVEYAYLLGDDERPSLERVVWSSDRASAQSDGMAPLFGFLADMLRARLGQPASPAVPTDEGRLEPVRQLDFRTRMGWVQVVLLKQAGDPEPGSLRISYQSHRLLDEVARRPFDPMADDRDAGVEATVSVTRTLLAESLRVRWPRLASLLASGSRLEDLPGIRSVLQQALPDRDDPALLAVDLWARGCCSPTEGMSEAEVIERFEAALGSFGLKMWPLHDGGVCASDTLLRILAARADSNRWTDVAFLTLMEHGWEDRCALCGLSSWPGPDHFRPVIERGDRFMLAHEGSTVWWDVLLLVAQAHETAWSLSKAAAGDEYIDPAEYVAEASAHRRRAIELYETILRRRPQDASRAMIMRLHRLRLDVDTDYHRFWCVWD